PPAVGKSPLTAQLARRSESPSQSIASTPPVQRRASETRPTAGPLDDPTPFPPSYVPELDAPPPIQRAERGASAAPSVHEAAAAGVSGPGSKLSHADAIARSFGDDHAATVHGITAHTDATASHAASAIGAEAYATGSHVALAPSAAS